jgi:hypothetical protein
MLLITHCLRLNRIDNVEQSTCSLYKSESKDIVHFSIRQLYGNFTFNSVCQGQLGSTVRFVYVSYMNLLSLRKLIYWATMVNLRKLTIILLITFVACQTTSMHFQDTATSHHDHVACDNMISALILMQARAARLITAGNRGSSG